MEEERRKSFERVEIKKARYQHNVCQFCRDYKNTEDVKEVWLGGLLVVKSACPKCLKILGGKLINIDGEK